MSELRINKTICIEFSGILNHNLCEQNKNVYVTDLRHLNLLEYCALLYIKREKDRQREREHVCVRERE